MKNKAKHQSHGRRGEKAVRAGNRSLQTREWIVPLVLWLAAAVVYLPALNGQLLWDDEFTIEKNMLLRHARGLLQIWTTVGTIPHEDHFWPVTYTVLWLQYQLWGEWAAGYHVVNIALHGLITVQVWRVARRIGLPGAAFGAALFALHPVHAEAVAWVTSLKDLLATAFTLASVECYLNSEDRGRRWLAWSAVAAAAAMLSKSSPVMLAAALAVLVWYRRGKFEKRDWIGIAAIAAVTIGIAWADVMVVRSMGGQTDQNIPSLVHRVAQSGWAFWFYLGKLIVPVRLSPVYPQWNLNAASPLDWLPLCAIVLATAALWLLRRRIGRGPMACWLIYGLVLSPVLGIVYFTFIGVSPAADRYQYAASIAPLIGAGALASIWLESKIPQIRQRAYAVAATVFLIAGTLTLVQAACYRGMESLFRHAITIAPKSAMVNQSLGLALLRDQKYAEAEPFLREAVRIEPNCEGGVCNLGRALYYMGGHAREAAEVYRKALDAGCDDRMVMSNLAWMMATSQDPEIYNPPKALELAEKSVQDPRDQDAKYWNSLAAALAANGRMGEAVKIARKARQMAVDQNATPLIQTLDQLIPVYEQAAAGQR